MTNELHYTLKHPDVIQADIIPIYAAMIALKYNWLFDWRIMNKEIITKWSESGLVRIKEAAWKAQNEPETSA